MRLRTLAPIFAAVTACGTLPASLNHRVAHSVPHAATAVRTAHSAPEAWPHKCPEPLAYLTAQQCWAFHRFILGLRLKLWLEASQPVWHYNWDAVAICETGGDWTMHGSRFSTGLGIMNEAVRENAPSADAAERMLAGTASITEQKQTAESIAARHGIDSWGCSGVA